MGAIFILPEFLPVEIGGLLLLNLDHLSGYSKLDAAHHLPASSAAAHPFLNPSFGDKMCSRQG